MNIDQEDIEDIGSGCEAVPTDFSHGSLRRLVTSEVSLDLKRKYMKKCLFVGVAVVVILGVFTRQFQSNRTAALIRDFFQCYRKHYDEIFYGKRNYCDSDEWFDSGKILKNIREENIIHQDRVLQQLEVALHKGKDLNVVALVGPVGVGKSLVLSSLATNFPWPENVHTYAWNTYMRDDSKKFRMLSLMLERLSDCGCNLLIIENLKPSDHDLVKRVNELIQQIVNGKKRLIIFYVFNLNWMRDEHLVVEQREFLIKTLPVDHVISFNPFTKAELRECVHREMILEKVHLIPEDLEDIIETIDVTHSGCKNVNAKVLMYGIRR
uniref:AAA+ ATPase domain-containing protein n=1 Tax=Glossina morsitans morsitans TaxID=37546 RepID=A0A1B0FH68_GLOMM